MKVETVVVEGRTASTVIQPHYRSGALVDVLDTRLSPLGSIFIYFLSGIRSCTVYYVSL